MPFPCDPASSHRPWCTPERAPYSLSAVDRQRSSSLGTHYSLLHTLCAISIKKYAARMPVARFVELSLTPTSLARYCATGHSVSTGLSSPHSLDVGGNDAKAGTVWCFDEVSGDLGIIMGASQGPFGCRGPPSTVGMC